MLKFFSDRHRFFLLTDNTVVHKYNIRNHIPREYGHQLGSNLNVSSVPVFHGSRTSPTWRTPPIYMCRKQAEIGWVRRGISIVAWCHSVKFCILAAWAFQSQQSCALTRMWRRCQVQLSQKECAIGAVHCKKEGTLLQHLSWCCFESAIHHKWDVRKEQHTYICDVNKQ